MSGFTRTARTYILFVSGAGLVVAVTYLLAVPIKAADLPALLLFTVICCAAEIFPIQLPRGDQMTVSTAISFATLLLFGPSAAIWQDIIASVIGDAAQRKTWYRIAFNVGQYSLTVALTALAYGLVHGNGVLLASSRSAFALGLAGLVYFVVNSSLVSMVIALTNRLPFKHVWLNTERNLFLSVGAMICIGVLVAVIWQVMPVAVLFLSLPTAVVYIATRTIFELLSQTRDALLELADTLDDRDRSTAKHSRRVAYYAEKIALELALPDDQVQVIAMAGHLHDLGKMTIRDELLRKPGPITPDEKRELNTHASLGARFLSHFSQFQAGVQIVRTHHERYDGTGYPAGLRGEAIPLGARIVAAADAYDAMTSDRPYRPAMHPSVAARELVTGIGTQFDPMVGAAFLKLLEREEGITVGPVEAQGVPITWPFLTQQARLTPTPSDSGLQKKA